MTSKFLKINKKLLLSALTGLFLLAFIFSPSHSNAAIAKLINFQGKLTKQSDGTNVADGNYGMQFKLYDASTSGNLLWTETWDATTTQVSLVNGVFSVKLGSITSLAGVDFTAGSLYLTVNFSLNGGTTYDGEMLPRKQLVTSPFAFNANNLVGDGRIGITTTSTTQSAMQVTYNPDSATSTPAAIITASSNVTGPALKVVQNGSGAAAILSGGNVGIGSTTPAALLSVQGTTGSTVDLFSVASSTNSSLFKVQSNGSATVASLISGLVRSTSSGLLYNGQAVLTTDVTGVLPVANGGTATSTAPSVTGQILAADGTGLKYAPTNLVAGSNITITTTTPGQITIASSAAGGSGNSAWTIGNGLIYNATSTDLVGIGTISPSTTLFVQGKGGTNPFAIASSTGTQLLTLTQTGNLGISSTTPVATLGVSGTLNVSGSTTIANLSNALPVRSTAAGALYNGAISLASGSNDITGVLGVATGGTATSTAPSVTGQILAADGTGLKYGPTNLVAGSNITITTTTPGQITLALGGNVVTTLATGTTGNIFNGSISSNTLTLNLPFASLANTGQLQSADWATFNNKLSGSLSANQIVYATAASSTAGSNNFVWINTTQSLGINSTTPQGSLVVQASSSAQTLPIFAVASTTGANFLTVTPGGNVGIGSTSPTALLGIQGTAGSVTDLLSVASSTGASQFKVQSNGSTTISSLVAGLVRTTASGNLYTDPSAYLTSISLTGGATISGSSFTFASASPDTSWNIICATSTCTFDHPNNLQTTITNPVTGTGVAGQVAFWSSSSAQTSDPAFLWSSGNHTLSVNSSTPNATLVVQGSSTAPTLDIFRAASSSNTTIFNVTAGGNVGIGTITPSSLLQVAGDIQLGSRGGASASNLVFNTGSTTNSNTVRILATTSLVSNLILTLPTTTPAAGQVITSDVNGNLYWTTSSGGGMAIGGAVTGGNQGNILYVNAGVLAQDAANFWDNSNHRLGINSTTPTATLALQGSSTAPTLDVLRVASSSSAVFLNVTAGGNVGIGTTTPSQALQVVGTASILTSTNNAFAFQVQNASNTPVFVVDTTIGTNLISNPGFENNTIGWSASGTNASIARITNHKYFGIASLQVNTPTTATSGAFTTLFTNIFASATQYTLSFFARVDSASSSFNTLIAGWSNTGSGVTSSCALNSSTVVNSGWTRYFCTFTTGTVSASPNIFIGQSDAVSRNFYIDSVQLQTGGSFTPYQVGGIQLRGIITNPVTINPGSNSVSAFQVQDTAGTANSFVVDTLNNKIGIGTTTPIIKLAIQGAAGSNDLLDISSSTGTSLFRVTVSGNVGISTTTPNAMLALQGSSGQTANLLNIASSTGASMLKVSAWGGLTLQTSSTTALSVLDLSGNNVFNVDTTNVASNSGVDITGGATQTGMLLNIASSTTTTMLQVSAYGGLVQNVASTSAVSIQNGSAAVILLVDSTNRKVGINTTTLAASLSVAGTGTIDPFDVASSSAVSFLRVTSGGNVGVGTSSPISQFSVNSTAALTNDQVTITNINNSVTTAGVSNLQLNYFGGAAAIESSAERVDLNPGITSGGTWNALRVTGGATGPLAGVIENSIKIQGPTAWGAGGQFNGINVTGLANSGTATGTIIALNIASVVGATATKTAISIGTGWDSALLVGTTSTSSVVSIVGNSTSPTQNILTVSSSSGGTILRVTASGNVGINTSTPAASLAIASQTGVHSFYVASTTAAGTSSVLFIIDKQGNVGVATATPNAKFAVAANCAGFNAAVSGRCTDYAEIYPASEAVDKAEIVSIGKIIPDSTGMVKKASVAYDPKILGIVSTNPAVVVEGNSVQLMNGADYTLEPYRPAIALAGRVPLKIMGDKYIHMGDFITSSNLPGIGMKAEHSGEVIGQALEDFDPGANTQAEPAIMVFVKIGYQVIGEALNLAAPGLPAGLSLDSQQTSSLDILSAVASSNKNTNNVPIINTGRIIAGLDITSPQLTGKALNIDFIAPALGKNLNINLPSGGLLTIGSGLLPGLTLDAAGNASFAGSLSAPTATISSLLAGHIISPDLDALKTQIDILASSSSASLKDLQTNLDNLSSSTQAALADLRTSFSTSGPSSLSLQDLVKDKNALTFSGPVKFEKGISVNTLAALDNGGISINGDVYFIGTPYFSSDTAGFAIIRARDTSVDISFSQAYLDQPIVNASISANATSTAGAQELFASSVFGSDVRYIITNKSPQGFTLLLNKAAPADIQFSWIALAVRSAKTFSSKNLSLPVAEAVTTSSSTPQSLSNATNSTSMNASTTPPVIPVVAGASTTTASSTLPTTSTISPTAEATSSAPSATSPANNSPASTSSPSAGNSTPARPQDPPVNPPAANPAPGDPTPTAATSDAPISKINQ